MKMNNANTWQETSNGDENINLPVERSGQTSIPEMFPFPGTPQEWAEKLGVIFPEEDDEAPIAGTDLEYDPVSHPKHYTSGKYEVIDIIEDQLGLNGLRNFCLGNAIKYICRSGKKFEDKTLEDLEKASWYLNHYIERAKETQNAEHRAN